MTAPTAAPAGRAAAAASHGEDGGNGQPARGRRPVPGLQLPARPSTTGWGATASAVGATALLVLFLARGVALDGSASRREASTTPRSAAPAERVVYLATTPPLPPSSAFPEGPTAVAPRRTPAVRQPAAIPPPAAAPSPRNPAAAARDSLNRIPTAPGTAAPRTPVAGMPGRSPLPALPAAPSAPVDRGRATCVAPCADVLTVGPRTGPAELDSAGRAARLRELGESVPELAREHGARLAGAASAGPTDPGGPPAMGGISLGIGLPGGGPTAAQRARDRKLHAQNMTMMARVRARTDPAVADSLARADSLRADSLARARRRPP